MGLEEGDSMIATLAPLQMHLPAEKYSVRFEPMKLVVATRGLLHGIIALLKCALPMPTSILQRMRSKRNLH
jgi:hypothetical protein